METDFYSHEETTEIRLSTNFYCDAYSINLCKDRGRWTAPAIKTGTFKFGYKIIWTIVTE